MGGVIISWITPSTAVTGNVIPASWGNDVIGDLAYLGGSDGESPSASWAWQVGDLKTTLRNTADSGWALCYGQTVDATVAPYLNLYNYANTNSLIGAGKPFTGTQAALVFPDLRSYALVGLDNMGGVARNLIASLNAMGTTYGEVTHTLSAAESGVGAHVHGIASDNTGLGGGSINTGSASSSTTTINTNSTSASASQGHNNVQPSYGINIEVKL